MRFAVVAILAVAASSILLSKASDAQAISRTCQYYSGPKAGQAEHFPMAMPQPLGAPCSDNLPPFPSFGLAVPDAGGGAAGIGAGPVATSHSCQYMSGIFAGSVVTYDWLDPLPVGSGCQDGFFGQGVIIASAVPPQSSNTCRYLVGPRAGSAQVFPNIDPVRVGLPCWDGVGSFGLATPSQPGLQQNPWNGDPATSPDPAGGVSTPPAAMAAAERTPLQVMQKCLLTSGANEALLTDCAHKNMPSNAVQACATNCNACFGKFDLNNYQCKAITGAAKRLGINLPKAAAKIDKVWGKLKRLF